MLFAVRLCLALAISCPAGSLLRAAEADYDLQARIAVTVARDLHLKTDPARLAQDLRVLAWHLQVPNQAVLHLAGMQRAPHSECWLLRLECDSTRECVPFLALLRRKEWGVGNTTEPSLLVPGAPDTHKSVSTPGRGSKLSIRRPDTSVRAGEHVRLAEALSGVRLVTTAVCLQGGAVGDVIRVRNLATRRVVRARVQGAGYLIVEN